MKITEAEPLIKSIMDEYVPDWEFRWDRATSRFGCCHHNLKRVTLSKALTELNPWDEVKDTLLHEIAHALVGKKHGHDAVWKAKCREIGARPYRCYGSSVRRPVEKWKGVCPKCGKIVYVYRRNNISCGRCSKIYDPRYKFVWEENILEKESK